MRVRHGSDGCRSGDFTLLQHVIEILDEQLILKQHVEEKFEQKIQAEQQTRA